MVRAARAAAVVARSEATTRVARWICQHCGATVEVEEL
jgi:hypothetical protein